MTTQYEQFCEDGYFVAKSVLDADTVQNVMAALARPFAHLCRQNGLPDIHIGDDDSLHQGMIALKENNQKAYMNALKLGQNDPSVLAVPAQPGVRAALREAGVDEPVVSLKPFPVMISDALHIEGGYNLRPFHQEWPVMQGSSDAVVCWIALHDVTEAHNALHLIPGTHKDGMLDYERTKCGTGILQELLPDVDPLRMEIKAGDAVVFSTFLAHGSSPIGGALRQALTIRFNNAAAADFIERGYPDPSRIEIERQPENLHRPTRIVRAR